MSDNDHYYGICTTCNHAPHCANSRNSKHPVWYCEMFDDYVPHSSQKISPKNSLRDSRDNSKSDVQYKGLCMNCENRFTCTMPRPEGGVWHCEEYR